MAVTLANIKWDVFTKEEKESIEGLVATGNFDAITRAIMMDSAEKEFWIAEILGQVRPIAEVLDSKVKQEMLNAKLKGEEIDTPEKEKEWEEKLKAEKEENASKKKAKDSKKK